MDLLRAILLGIVQGATEFLPISSSGHLVLVPWLLSWPEPGLVFDAIVHWGTLVAVLVYFRDDLSALVTAGLAILRDRRLNPDPERRLVWLIILGTIPAVVAGFLFKDFFESLFARPNWAASFLLVTGLLLAASERQHHRRGGSDANENETGVRLASPLRAGSLPIAGVLVIGVAQAIAIAPGVSRSGATIAAGLMVGLSRRESARFSFLLATPAILGAGVLQLVDLAQSGTASVQAPALIAGFLVAAGTGYLAIRFLLDYVRRHTLYLFAVYCWIAGLLGLGIYWFR